MVIVFIRIVHVSLYGASQTFNYVRRYPPNPYGSKKMRQIFRISHSCSSRRSMNIISCLQNTFKFTALRNEKTAQLHMIISLRIENKNFLKRYLNQGKFTFSIVNAAELYQYYPQLTEHFYVLQEFLPNRKIKTVFVSKNEHRRREI